MELVLTALRERGHTPKRSGQGWSSTCPAHQDTSPSLTINTGDDGRALLKCHANAECDHKAICAAIGLQPADLFVTKSGGNMKRSGKSRRSREGLNAVASRKRSGTVQGEKRTRRVFDTPEHALSFLDRIIGTKREGLWTYLDAAGRPVFMVARFPLPPDPETPDAGPGKTFRPVALVEDGWIIADPPGPLPLYSLPDLLVAPEDTPVYVCEGEKATDAARGCGLVATTSSHGAESPGNTDWSPLAGRDVVILPDHDDAGEKYAAAVARLATDAGAKSIRIVRLAEHWAGMLEGGDMADLLQDRGGDTERVRRDVESAAVQVEPIKLQPTPIDGSPVVRRMSDCQAENVSWLWPQRIPLGCVTVFAGRQGLGKSFATIDWASRVSKGIPWPDGATCPTGSVLLVTAEDSPAKTIRPRLDANGADAERVFHFASVMRSDDQGNTAECPFTLADIESLEQALKLHPDCRLVILDPIGSFVGSGTDTDKDNKVRAVLGPLAALAERTGIAVVVVAHQRKQAATHADDMVLGSVGFTAMARSVLHLMEDPDNPDRRLFLPGKMNYCRQPKGLAFTINDRGRVVWERDPVGVTANGVLAATQRSGDGAGARKLEDAAKDWLLTTLASGPKLSTEIQALAGAAGHKKATLQRARDGLANQCLIKKIKQSFHGPWSWTLADQVSESDTPPAEDDCPPPVECLGEENAAIAADSSKVLTSRSVSALGEKLGDDEQLGAGLSISPQDSHPPKVLIQDSHRREGKSLGKTHGKDSKNRPKTLIASAVSGEWGEL
jgi:hypothetical protein